VTIATEVNFARCESPVGMATLCFKRYKVLKSNRCSKSFHGPFFQLGDEGIGFNTKCRYTAYDDCSYTFWYAEKPNGIVIKVDEEKGKLF